MMILDSGLLFRATL